MFDSPDLLILFGLLAVSAVELGLYFALIGGYFRLGPVVATQTWRTGVDLATATSALAVALDQAGLPRAVEYGPGAAYFSVRKPWYQVSAYPRMVLRVEAPEPPAPGMAPAAGPAGAVITYEIRPFLSMFLFAYLVVRPLPGAELYSYLVVGGILAGYAYFWLWELRGLRDLQGVLGQLASIGVRVCPRCGYNLRFSGGRCPECGADVPAKA